MISFAAVMKAIQMAGAHLPAFKELFDQVVTTFTSEEQEELRSAYEKARERSDTAHDNLQQAARDAGS